ncbi:Crp/Fnr family transcriptional regulator [Zunongwangia sp.]|uniref:Crp/Fnr family transcriptional regulator n=1 Tax=Zunongwangia sp. TaxID=1965325 RepID=UPI003AA97069
MSKELFTVYQSIFEKELLEEIAISGKLMQFKEGDFIIDINARIISMPLVISGAIKVLREDTEGDELLLYFLEQGETCAMSLDCCLGESKSEIRAIAEKETKVIMIPISKMQIWLGKYKSWRDFVFNSYHTRLKEMLGTIDTIAFLNMDSRIYKYLQNKALINKNKDLTITHKQIAIDLHTSRVVVSRILKKLEIDNKITLFRNHIKIV